MFRWSAFCVCSFVVHRINLDVPPTDASMGRRMYSVLSMMSTTPEPLLGSVITSFITN